MNKIKDDEVEIVVSELVSAVDGLELGINHKETLKIVLTLALKAKSKLSYETLKYKAYSKAIEVINDHLFKETKDGEGGLVNQRAIRLIDAASADIKAAYPDISHINMLIGTTNELSSNLSKSDPLSFKRKCLERAEIILSSRINKIKKLLS